MKMRRVADSGPKNNPPDTERQPEIPVNVQSHSILTTEKQEELLSLVECPICTNIPSPPVLGCSNGHHICGSCRGMLTKCPQCSAPFVDSRNRFAENVIALLRLQCEHSGCGALVPGDTYRRHLEQCNFRPVQCYLETPNRCNGRPVNFDKYEDHLKSDHKALGYDLEQPCYEFFHMFHRPDERTHVVFYMKYDGRLFLLHVAELNQVIYSWVSLVEAEGTAEPEYQATITFYNKHSTRARCVFQIFVTNFRKPFDVISETMDIAGLPKTLLIPSCVKVLMDAYQWRVTVRIRSTNEFKNSPAPSSEPIGQSASDHNAIVAIPQSLESLKR